jgi:hypothetical protein
MGEILAQMACSERPPLDIELFSLERLKAGNPS